VLFTLREWINVCDRAAGLLGFEMHGKGEGRFHILHDLGGFFKGKGANTIHGDHQDIHLAQLGDRVLVRSMSDVVNGWQIPDD
jgi:hypothetical protein